ncbi:MAG: AAA family ATPase [Gammaproteobacteria bacterium]|nr:AAA family ATPase [Gammaproteobacteria bacterium]
MNMTESETLAAALLSYWRSGLSDNPAAQDEAHIIETHISWLILVGSRAYKLKKPVNLGFIDCSTLHKRRFYCQEEIRLNRRTAPGIYIDVMSVSGSPEMPLPGDAQSPIDYLVAMKRFPPNSLMLDMARSGALSAPLISRLARVIADFHQKVCSPNDMDNPFGEAEDIMGPVLENFRHINALKQKSVSPDQMKNLADWTRNQFIQKQSVFIRRKQAGHIRECHGDLHLGNIFVDNGQPVLFDCIEFNPQLRWIDTVSDMAFTVMDLESHNFQALAHQLVNEYLEYLGDYEALFLLRFYKSYRAMVRAKVAAIQATQKQTHQAPFIEKCAAHLRLAESYMKSRQPVLIICCGLSGTGKTTIARRLVLATGAIQIRSDIERKRLHGLGPLANSELSGANIYSEEASEKTFAYLEKLATMILDAGYSVIVDATFIEQKLRSRFLAIAESKALPSLIVHTISSEDTCKIRLQNRRQDASEAGYQQYLAQSAKFEAFTDEERALVVQVDTENESAIKKGLQEAALRIHP